MESGGIDEVRRREGREPCACKARCGSEAERVRPQALGRQFAAGEPRVRGYHAVVAEHVDGREADGDFPRRAGVGLLVVYDGDDELEDAADEEAGHEEDAAAAVADDDGAVCDEGEDGDGAEDVGHGEGVGDACHLEEVGFECCGRRVRECDEEEVVDGAYR